MYIKSIKNLLKNSFFIVILCLPTKTIADVGITSLTELSLQSFSVYQDISGSATACVCSDSFIYNITILGSGINNSYTINDGSEAIPYSIYWNDRNSSSGKREIRQSLSGLSTSYDCANYNCNNQTNAYLEIYFSKSDLMAAKHGSYSGYIVITVEPN